MGALGKKGGGLSWLLGASEINGRESEESTCHKSFYGVTQCDLTRSSDLRCLIYLLCMRAVGLCS